MPLIFRAYALCQFKVMVDQPVRSRVFDVPPVSWDRTSMIQIPVATLEIMWELPRLEFLPPAAPSELVEITHQDVLDIRQVWPDSVPVFDWVVVTK